MSAIDIFSPFQLGPLVLPNRAVMAPMTRNRAGPGNVPGVLATTYYAQRASAGLIVSEATQISPQGLGYPGTPGIHSPEQTAGWKQVTTAVHTAGGRIFLQLWHVGRISHPALQPDGALPVAPSAIAPAGQAWTLDGMKPYATPRALEAAEIAGIVEDYRRGARNARLPASTAWSCTAPTAIWSISFCVTAPTSAAIATVAAHRIARASLSKSPKRL